MRAALLLLLAAAAPAVAQPRHDSTAPINFSADHVELADKANRATFTGNVVVTQTEMTLNAQRLTVAYTGQVVGGNPQVSRLDAAGGVTLRRPDQAATARYAIYDLNRRVVTMLGGVTLRQHGNNVSGARLTLNLDTGHAVIDGSAVGGSGSAVQAAPGGRVSGTFSAPQHSQ